MAAAARRISGIEKRHQWRHAGESGGSVDERNEVMWRIEKISVSEENI